MTVLINYANSTFRKVQKLNSKTGLKLGLFDKVISYGPKDIDPEFFEKNKKILSKKRGAGYWLWKPHFIRKSLCALDFGDFLFYCDSGSYFLRPITPLIECSLERGQDLILFELGAKERSWTKRDAFIVMDCDSPKYSESKQRLASYSLWRKSRFTIDFVNEWLHFSQDERIITDSDNQCGYRNYPGFQENRHDQSIFSLLTKKYRLDGYRDPSQWGNTEDYVNSKYEQIIAHIRGGKVPSFRKVIGQSRRS